VSKHIHKPVENHINPADEIPNNTICHTHRLAWREADRIGSSNLKRLIEIAYDQGVRMDRKLRWLNKLHSKLIDIAKQEIGKRDPEQ
jgi:hypothetical protein